MSLKENRNSEILNPSNLCYMCAALHLFFAIDEIFDYLSSEKNIINYLNKKYVEPGQKPINSIDEFTKGGIKTEKDLVYNLYNVILNPSEDNVKKFFNAFRDLYLDDVNEVSKEKKTYNDIDYIDINIRNDSRDFLFRFI